MNGMKRKIYILGVLAALCLSSTGYYAWTLYDTYCKQVAEWNEGAKAAFEEALWLEVNKRAEVPINYSSGKEDGAMTLNTRVSDIVYITSDLGRKEYRIGRTQYENSLIKETMKRGHLSVLLEKYPLSIDDLSVRWDSILSEKQMFVSNMVRYIYTDLGLHNDTIYSPSDKRKSCLDSLTVKYMGFRCEHEVVAYVSYPYWLLNLSDGNYCILLFPWILLMLLSVCYSKLETLVMRVLTQEKVIEKTVEIEKEIIVEKEIYVAIDKIGILKLSDGTIFDSFAATLTKGVLQQRLQPQSLSLLKLFLGKENRQLTSEEICMKLWGNTGHSERLYSAISRLRNDLKAVKSDLFVSCSYGVYELKFPISSKNPGN